MSNLRAMSFGSQKNAKEEPKISQIGYESLSSRDNLLADDIFKAIFSEPKVAIRFIHLLMPFLKDDLDISKVSTYQYNGEELRYCSSEERLERIKKRFTKQISETDKLIEFDILFDYQYGPESTDVFTINIEMQNSKAKYDMATRAVYYAARVLTGILGKGQKYLALHKVYSIWLLNYKYFDDDTPIHSIGMRVFNNKESNALTNNPNEYTNYKYNKNSDLMEVVFIELPKLSNILKETQLRKFLETLVSSRKGDISERLKNICGLDDEEVLNMSEYLTYAEELEARGYARGEARGAARVETRVILNAYDSLKSVAEVARILQISVDKVELVLKENNIK